MYAIVSIYSEIKLRTKKIFTSTISMWTFTYRFTLLLTPPSPPKNTENKILSSFRPPTKFILLSVSHFLNMHIYITLTISNPYLFMQQQFLRANISVVGNVMLRSRSIKTRKIFTMWRKTERSINPRLQLCLTSHCSSHSSCYPRSIELARFAMLMTGSRHLAGIWKYAKACGWSIGEHRLGYSIPLHVWLAIHRMDHRYSSCLWRSRSIRSSDCNAIIVAIFDSDRIWRSNRIGHSLQI